MENTKETRKHNCQPGADFRSAICTWNVDGDGHPLLAAVPVTLSGRFVNYYLRLRQEKITTEQPRLNLLLGMQEFWAFPLINADLPGGKLGGFTHPGLFVWVKAPNY